jgi:hypothetical protein
LLLVSYRGGAAGRGVGGALVVVAGGSTGR